MTKTPITVAFAGSTKHSLMIAQAIQKNKNLSIPWILTPIAKKVGRKQVVTKNPIHVWGETQEKSQLFFVEKKINKYLKKQLSYNTIFRPNYLLVVDFGYIIPQWLLDLPKKAVLNIHPSALPRWRGSSPGQFVLLSSDKTSAVSLMRLTNKLDSGPIIKQLEFEVNQTWTSDGYYQHSFSLASKTIAQWLIDYHKGQTQEEIQPDNSPTPLARKIAKDDAFIPWEILRCAMGKSHKSQIGGISSSILLDCLAKTKPHNWAYIIERASRTFTPWPILWTKVINHQGEEVRMQILQCSIEKQSDVLPKSNASPQTTTPWAGTENKSPQIIADNKSPQIINKLNLELVKIAGKKATKWNEIKNSLKV